MSLDVSYAAAIANWVAAPPASKEATYGLIAAIPGFGRGLFPFEAIVLWLALSLTGMGIIQSRLYPPWIGMTALILGPAGVLIGTVQTFTGREALFIFYIGLSYRTMVARHRHLGCPKGVVRGQNRVSLDEHPSAGNSSYAWIA